MRIPDQVLKCAVFLGVNAIPGVETSAHFAGTGSLVSVEHDGEIFPYIVTAKHVVEDIIVYTKANPTTSFVRLNDYTGSAFQISLVGSSWVMNADPMVDLAVCPIEFPRQGLTFIPETAFVQPSQFNEYGIGLGDEVFSVGLLSFVVSEKSNVPVVRYGTLAMLPSEPVKTKGGMREVYLLEARSIGGLSGSPVFIRETVWLGPQQFDTGEGKPVEIRPFALGRTFLLGVMRGHWDIDPETINSLYMRSKKRKDGGVNVGIAMATPASKLSEILHGPLLTAIREERLKKKRAKKQAEAPEETEDSVISEEALSRFEDLGTKLFQIPKAETQVSKSPKKPRKKR